MTKILVTGGLGFIGSNLIPELKSRGHEVWVCDLKHSEGPNYIRCDVSKYRQLERIFEEHNFDYVYHLAAEYGRWNGEDYYENLWMANVIGTKNMIRLQEKKRFRMIFFSSAEVYGDYNGKMSEDSIITSRPIPRNNKPSKEGKDQTQQVAEEKYHGSFVNFAQRLT
jgi:dTDP-glucose 4,6-dehydratase